MTLKNGDRYEGYWASDQKHGNGREVSGDGFTIHEGIWKEGTIWKEDVDEIKSKQTGRNYRKKGTKKSRR